MTDFSEKWRKEDKRRKEPSQRFYDIVISGTIGMFIGIVVTLWLILK